MHKTKFHPLVCGRTIKITRAQRKRIPRNRCEVWLICSAGRPLSAFSTPSFSVAFISRHYIYPRRAGTKQQLFLFLPVPLPLLLIQSYFCKPQSLRQSIRSYREVTETEHIFFTEMWTAINRIAGSQLWMQHSRMAPCAEIHAILSSSMACQQKHYSS